MNELDEMYEAEERDDRQKHDDKLKELAKIQEAVNWQKQYTEDKERLEEQIKKMKSIGRTSYIKGIRTMANALKDYDRTDGSWTDYFEHTVDKVLKKLLTEIKDK